MKPRDMLLALLVMLIWAFNFPVSKLGFADFPPLLFMALRFVLVTLLICPFRRPPRDKLVQIILVSITLGTCHFSLMFSGLARTDSATAALLVQSQVPFAVVLAAVFLKDRLTLRMVLGMAIALVGVALIVGQPRFGSDPLPVIMILGAAFTWAVANLQFKRLGAIDGFVLSGWMSFFAWPQLLVLSLFRENDHLALIADAGWRGWSAVVYGAVCVTILSYALWYPLMRKYLVSQVMPYTLLVPVLTVALGYVILGERLGWQAMIGGAATIAGVAILVLRRVPAPAR